MDFRRALRFFPAVLCMAAIFWLSAQPGNEVAQATKPLYDSVPTIGNAVKIPWLKVGHVIGYGALGAALLYAFIPGRRYAELLSLAVTLLYALTDEFHQTFTPGRHAGFNDLLIDVGAAGVMILLIAIILRLRNAHR